MSIFFAKFHVKNVFRSPQNEVYVPNMRFYTANVQ